ncbi:S8 family peptidase [Burkholderia sp. Ac-20392]|uniref:S8 family peptidase n=1 Tax=Burkholderia sp. Ac-20392 TaxID=2703905 RepID=UPI001F1209F8|nr:S8 family peptidase [Burkholderia sp. Ac-20392]
MRAHLHGNTPVSGDLRARTVFQSTTTEGNDMDTLFNRLMQSHTMKGMTISLLPALLVACGGGGGDGGNPDGSPGAVDDSSIHEPSEPGNGSGGHADDDTWHQQCYADDTSMVAADGPALNVKTNQLVVKLRTSSSGSASAFGLGPRDATADVAALTRVVDRINARSSANAPRGLPVRLDVKRLMSGGSAVLTASGTSASAAALAAELMRDPEVEYAEPDMPVRASAEPLDPHYRDTWHLHDGDVSIRMPGAWDITQGKREIVTAVIDTGVTAHPELAANLLPGYSFVSSAVAANGVPRGPRADDPGDWISPEDVSAGGPFQGWPMQDSSWHGTRVAGIIGAAANNGIGIAGINWYGGLLPVRVLGKGGGPTSDVVDGMRWSAGLPVAGVPLNPHPARVVNLSLGSAGTCSRAFQDAVDDLLAKGVTVVAAAGNGGSNAIDMPANCRGVISVGASDNTGRRAFDSNTHPAVTLSAPGVGIYSLANDGARAPGAASLGIASGTSFATPQVSGVVSLMLAVNPSLSPRDIADILKRTARFPEVAKTTRSCRVIPAGRGLLDARAAINAAASARTGGRS